MTLVLPAPAKLNLFLHITGRRPDGYHLLQTVFQLLDYGDELSFSLQSSNQIGIEPALAGIPQENNLIYKAADALKKATGYQGGVLVNIKKRLPSGAGLGGGSSDAATTLLALNKLWQLGLDIETLAAIGLPLGADIPVFVKGKSAWAEGVGEELTPVELPQKWFLVIYPGCHVETGKIFCHEELTRNDLPSTIRAFLGAGTPSDYRNTCQPVVETLYPEVKEARQWLSHYSENARMTGTGACIFAAFSEREDAQRILAKLPDKWQGFIARGVNRSPVHTALLDTD